MQHFFDSFKCLFGLDKTIQRVYAGTIVKLKESIAGTNHYIVYLFQTPCNGKQSECKALWNDLVELAEADDPRQFCRLDQEER